MQIIKQHLRFLLCLSILVISVSPAKAQTDPCSRIYSIAASVMSARQYSVLLPKVLETTNMFIDALDPKQKTDVNNVVREMIVSAYKLKLGVFPSDSAIDEFANLYALRCIEGKDDRLTNIDWNQRTIDAVAGWTASLESGKASNKLLKAFEQAEAAAKALEEQKEKEQAERAVIDAIAEEKVAGRALDQMTTRITRSWKRPVGFQGGLEVYLRMTLASDGELVDVRVVRSSDDVLFDRSAITAVKRAAPFDEVKQFDEATFEEKFRSLIVKFRPED